MSNPARSFVVEIVSVHNSREFASYLASTDYDQNLRAERCGCRELEHALRFTKGGAARVAKSYAGQSMFARVVEVAA